MIVIDNGEVCPKCKSKIMFHIGTKDMPNSLPIINEYVCFRCGHYFTRYSLRDIPEMEHKEEATTMQVTYKGFTGELVKLKRTREYENHGYGNVYSPLYSISIYDRENKVTYSFNDVKKEDLKFQGVEVTFK